jgi:hypothetical protein
MLHYIGYDQLWSLGVEPFLMLNAKGSMHSFFKLYPMLMRLFLAGDKPKIVSASFFMCAEILHLIECRPDIGLQIAQNAMSFNELFIEYLNGIIHNRCENHNVTDFQGLRTQSVASSKERQEKAAFERSFKSEATNEGMQHGNGEQRARPDSEVAKLSNRFLPGGAQHKYALKLVHEWFLLLLRMYAKLRLEPGVEQAFRGHRILEMLNRRMDERQYALNVYLNAKKARSAAGSPRTPRPPVNPALPPRNEFVCFLYANKSSFLADVIKAKVESSSGAVTWKPGSRIQNKEKHVAALTRAFRLCFRPTSCSWAPG